MKPLTEEHKFRLARHMGLIYFTSLGLINFGATYFYSVLRPLDFIILVLGCLPVLVNKKLFLLFYGLAASIISVIMGLACVANNLNPEIHATQLSYNMGYLLLSSMFLSSLLLAYDGLRSFDRKNIVLG